MIEAFLTLLSLLFMAVSKISFFIVDSLTHIPKIKVWSETERGWAFLLFLRFFVGP